MRWAYLLFSVTGFAAIGMSFHGAEKVAKQTPDPQPIFQAHCVSCHSGAKPAAGLDLSQSADKLASLYIVAKGDASDSLIIRRVTSKARPMPPQGAPLADADVATLRGWITSQVPDPTPVFQAKCIKCHAGANPAGRMDLSKSLGDLRSISEVKPGDAASSPLYLRVTNPAGRMPPGGPALSDSDVKLIQGWINSLNDPTVVINGKCMPCHRGANAAGGMNLAKPLADLANLKEIAKGDPDESLLDKRIRGRVQPLMPPPDSRLTLSDAEVGILEHWIKGLGAQ
jgi:mono/diheme cytochrome c family protein